MKNIRASRGSVLRSLVAVIVDEWGMDAVRGELERLSAQAFTYERESDVTASVGTGRRIKDKPSASALAAKVSLPPTQKQLVQDLAAKFDNKHFLPSAGDIKYFFEVHGEAPPPVKQRREAFRRVLRLLSSLPESSLRKIITDGSHSGPSSLAPLSDAIRDVGAKRGSVESPATEKTAGDGTASSDA
jgi:hypothetical protein